MKNKFYLKSFDGKNSKVGPILGLLGITIGIGGFLSGGLNFVTILNYSFLMGISVFNIFKYFNAPYFLIGEKGYEIKSNSFKKAEILRNEDVEEIYYDLSNLRITTKSGNKININLTVLGYEDRQKIKRHIREIDMDRFEIYHN